MTTRFFDPRPQMCDANGNPISGAKLYTYRAGTSSAFATYSDSALTVANSNPIVFNSEGRPPNDIFFAAANYRLILTDASDVVIWTADPVDGATTDLSNSLLTVTGTADAIILTAAFVSSTYQAGQILRFIATSTPTSTTPSVNWNGLGAKTIVESDGGPLPTGTWGNGSLVEIIYDGTNFRKLMPVATVNYSPILVNGGLDIWQASTSLAIAAGVTATASIYSADQWCMETSANQACVVSQQAGTGTARFRVRVQRNSGQTGVVALRFQQPLEVWECVKMRGRVMTVSFTGRAGANFSGTLSVKLLCGTGTEGRRTNAAPYTNETSPLSQSITLTTTDTRYSGTSTAVAATTTQASLVFEWTPSGTAGAADWFEVQEVTLDFAGAAVPAVREPYQQTLARCQRFYEGGRVGIAGYAGAPGGPGAAPTQFKVTKRDLPTITPGAADISINIATAGFDTVTSEACRYAVTATAAGSFTAYQAWTASARL
ncbi:hypothetical protein GXW71_28205 [Roseomonas hellenica]|uniref:Uncharacterized protein n=1 Tax=Plastoroseomonas hellenica TaxID=2687306 RepID=A0ABS5F6S6_9PROT|nr:hypothetical protein [Plastoroseomonas hellenica]MBR0668268.1 hypothetical protein [Plastoroseomonas hellenica]